MSITSHPTATAPQNNNGQQSGTTTVTHHPKLLHALGGHSTVILSNFQQQQQRSSTVGELLSQNKVVLLYFSAYWCKPCKRVTPLLKEWYLARKNQSPPANESSSSFEILFVSLDTFETEYDYYTRDMPWWSLPLPTSQALHPSLAQHYNPQGGIPTLAVVENDRLVRMDAIPQVLQEYNELQQQQVPINPMSMMPAVSSPRSSSPSWMHAPLTWAQWFSNAHWNLPCLKATNTKAPTLNPNSRFVLVWVTAGPNDSHFLQNTMQPLVERLKDAHSPCTLQMLHINLDKSLCPTTLSIPSLCPTDDTARSAFLHKYPMVCPQSCSLLVLGPACRKGIERCIIHPNALSELPSLDNTVLLDDWIRHPFGARRYGDLNSTAIDLASTPAVVVFAEACDDCEQQSIAKALQDACRTYHRHIDPCHQVWFLSVFQPQSVSQTLHSILGLSSRRCTGPNVTMVLVDFANQEQFYVAPCTIANAELTSDNIVAFIQSPEAVGGKKYTLASPCQR